MNCSLYILFLLLCLGFSSAVAQPIRYVDVDAQGTGDGSSWTDAFTDLRTALSNAQTGDEIWVAEGIYLLSESGASTFQMKNGVSVYGGFEAGARNRNERDPISRPTILSASPSLPSTVVTTSGTDRSAILDGFIIQDGEGDIGGGLYNRVGSPTIRSVTFRRNSAERGAGMASIGGEPLLIDCTFVDNEASAVGEALGGALYVEGGSIVVYNSQFVRNRALARGSDDDKRLGLGRGGAAHVYYGNAVFVNSLFAENEVSGEPYTSDISGRTFSGHAQGGAVYTSFGANLTIINSTIVDNKLTVREGIDLLGGGLAALGRSRITNSILWGNDLQQIAGGATVEYSVVESGYRGISVHQFDPHLLENYQLRRFSFAIDAGRTRALPPDSLDLDGDGNASELLPVDALGGPRVFGAAVDLGFVENRDPVTPPEENYFPIQLGNSWTYYRLTERHDAPPDTAVGLPQAVSDAIWINDTLYFRVPHPNGFADTLRDDGEGRIWARLRGNDVLLYDFTLDESDKYTFDLTEASHDTYEVTIERDVVVDVAAGRFENCVRITFDIPEAVDDARSFLFAPGVGIITTYDGMGDGRFLSEAVVDERVISRPKRYYPLAIGNSWRYGAFEFTINDTVSVNDTLYYVVPNPWAYPDTLREDEQGRIWGRTFGKDFLLYDFTVADGSTHDSDLPEEFPGYQWRVTTLRKQTVEVPAGEFTGCVALYFNIPGTADAAHVYFFAPGIGIVVIAGFFGVNFELASAIVGSRVIAVEDDVPTSTVPEAVAYPNPFVGSTTILFPITGATTSTATVYDVLGRTVAKLSTTECSINGCAFRWDRGDASNGLYFVVSDEGRRDVVSVVLAR